MDSVANALRVFEVGVHAGFGSDEPGAEMGRGGASVFFLVGEDEAGGDEKIVAVPAPKLSRRYESVHEYTDLPEITRQQIQHFFEHYKDLEPGKWVKITGWGDATEAKRLITEGIARYAADQAK